jgi:hypothetical protein
LNAYVLRGFCLVGAGAIAYASLEYLSEDEAAFIVEKLPLPFEAVWRGALWVHIPSALWCLPACTVLSSGLLVRRPHLHRWLGRVTGVIVLAALISFEWLRSS